MVRKSPYRPKRSKGRIIYLLAFLVIVVAGVVTMFAYKNVDGISLGENIIGAIITPVQRGFNGMVNGIEDYLRKVKLRQNIEIEYNKVVAQNQQYIIDAMKANELEQENKELKAFLGAKVDNQNMDPMLATIIGKDATSWFITFTIDKGTMDGVEKGMAVITEKGLVGRITEAGVSHSKIMSIIDPRSSIAVISEINRDHGILTGAIDTQDVSALCYMTNLPAQHTLRPGDAIRTSGLDGVFAKGLYIGVVQEVSRERAGVEQYITIQPAVDFQHLEYVLVLKDKGAEVTLESDYPDFPVQPTPVPPVGQLQEYEEAIQEDDDMINDEMPQLSDEEDNSENPDVSADNNGLLDGMD